MNILRIDPAYSIKAAAGWAFFSNDGVLRYAGLVRRRDESQSAASFGLTLANAIRERIAVSHPGYTDIAVEGMRVYGHHQQKGDQNDLLRITEVGATALGHLASMFSTSCIDFIPAPDWKFTVDPDVLTQRIKDRLAESPEAEVAVRNFMIDAPRTKSLWHNGYDAIGMGLHHFGRLHRR